MLLHFYNLHFNSHSQNEWNLEPGANRDFVGYQFMLDSEESEARFWYICLDPNCFGPT